MSPLEIKQRRRIAGLRNRLTRSRVGDCSGRAFLRRKIREEEARLDAILVSLAQARLELLLLRALLCVGGFVALCAMSLALVSL